MNDKTTYSPGDLVYINRIPATVLMPLINPYPGCAETQQYVVKLHAGTKMTIAVYEAEIDER